MSDGAAISQFRTRVILEAPIDTLDDAGSVVRTYAPVASLWAKVTPLRGEDRFVASRQEEAVSHIVRMRWRRDIVSQMRFALGSRRLLIHAAYDADGRHRFLICHCEEIKA